MAGVEKACSRCREVFECGQYGCWCAQVSVTDWQYDWIAGHFSDCLCRTCLEKIGTGELGPLPQRPLF